MNAGTIIKLGVIKTFTLHHSLISYMLGDALINMTAGMILGMAVCPIMMKAIKNLRQNIRVNRILREISDTHKES